MNDYEWRRPTLEQLMAVDAIFEKLRIAVGSNNARSVSFVRPLGFVAGGVLMRPYADNTYPISSKGPVRPSRGKTYCDWVVARELYETAGSTAMVSIKLADSSNLYVEAYSIAERSLLSSVGPQH